MASRVQQLPFRGQNFINEPRLVFNRVTPVPLSISMERVEVCSVVRTILTKIGRHGQQLLLDIPCIFFLLLLFHCHFPSPCYICSLVDCFLINCALLSFINFMFLSQLSSFLLTIYHILFVHCSGIVIIYLKKVIIPFTSE